MEPTSFDEENLVLGPPPGVSEEDCQSLSVHRAEGPPPMVISCFKVTKEELETISRTGRVWLIVWGVTMPPVILTADSPFTPSTPQQGGP